MINRRHFMRNAAVFGAGAALPSFMSTSAFAQEVMRLYWWGNPDRAARTEAVVDLFEAANSGVTINGEVNGSDYWPKLTTMMAGNNAPDILQMEPGRFADFSRRNMLMPLDEYVGSVIRTDNLAPGVMELGTTDGRVTGVPISLNAFATFYDTTAFEETGIAPPNENTTWDEFAELCINLTKALNKPNVYAIGNCSHYSFAIEAWVRQRGKLFFTEGGQLGFDVQDLADWYQYWKDLADAGGCAGAEMQALDRVVIDSNPMATGNAVMAFAFSNQLAGFQGVSQGVLDITTMPIRDAESPSGLFYRPGVLWSVANNAANPELAAKFIDFFINDIEAGKALQVERGVPVNVEVRDAVLPELDEVSRKTVDYIASIEDIVGEYPPAVPIGATELGSRGFSPVAQKVSFGRSTPQEGAEELFELAERLLK